MKRLFLSLCFLSCFLLVATLQAQENDQTQNVVIIKTADKDGSITVKKKRLENGQSAQDYVKDLNIDNAENIEVIISTTGNENVTNGDNLFYFKSNDGQKIKITGDGDWQEALLDFDFDFDFDDMHGHHGKVHVKKRKRCSAWCISRQWRKRS